MPWFPDFVSAAELARTQTRATAQADPATQFLHALNSGDDYDLKLGWPGEVVVQDPRVGEIRGHRRLRRFIADNHSWLAERGARVETVATTRAQGRAVLELLVRLRAPDGSEVEWPVAVVAESRDDLSVVFRTYCSQWPVEGKRPPRPAFLPPGGDPPEDVVARYQTALELGDADAIVQVFAPDAYYREPIGPRALHRGAAEIGSYFGQLLGGGGVGLQPCVTTDDGTRCALEYNVVRWGDQALPPQAGLGVYERGPGGLLAAVRRYDDIQPPTSQLARAGREAELRSDVPGRL